MMPAIISAPSAFAAEFSPAFFAAAFTLCFHFRWFLRRYAFSLLLQRRLRHSLSSISHTTFSRHYARLILRCTADFGGFLFLFARADYFRRHAT
jgi:hypothetical protein